MSQAEYNPSEEKQEKKNDWKKMHQKQCWLKGGGIVYVLIQSLFSKSNL